MRLLQSLYRSSVVPIAAVVIATSVARSQDAPRAGLELDVSRATRTVSLRASDGVLRADGFDYLATFDDLGAVFTPALGRRAQRPYPIRLSTESLHRDGYTVDASVRSAPDSGDLTVSYARAPGVVERWRVRPDGIELTYTLKHKPSGTGDLVVRVRVQTDLTVAAASANANEAGLLLRAAEIGGVRIGTVTGVDDMGRRVGGGLRMHGDILELRVPGWFVDAATYPLVIDPLIGTEITIATGSDHADPDVAYDVASGRYLVVWQREIAIGDADIMAQLFDAQGGPAGSLFVVRNTAPARGVAIRPAVANVRERGRFVVAWREATSLAGPWHIACRCVDPDGSLSSIVAVANSGLALDEPGPELGGNALFNDDAVLLTWANQTSVLASRVPVPAGSGPPNVLPPSTVASGPGLSVEGLDVTKSCGVGGRWVVVWTGSDAGSRFLRLRALNLNSLPLGIALGLVTGVPAATSPAIDGDGTDFALAFRRGSQVRCHDVHWNGISLVSDPPTQLNQVPITTGVVDVDVANLGPKYLVVWSAPNGGPLESDIHGITLDPTSCLPCGVPFTIPRTGRYDYQPAIAPQYAARASDGDQAFIAFSSARLTSPFSSELFGHRFDAIGQGGSFQNIGGGCGATLRLNPDGAVAIGNRSLRLVMTGISGASSAFLDVGLPGVQPFRCGSCLATPPLVSLPMQLSFNAAFTALPIHCDPSLIGVSLELQGLTLGLPSSCPLVGDLSFSDRHTLTIGT